MEFEVWLAFAVATAVLVAIPGPTVMLVVSYVLSLGRGSAWATIPGVALGDFTAMTASLAGAGAIMATSAILFSTVKFAGAIYLIWLGIKLWRSAPPLADLPAESSNENDAGQSFNSLFWKAYIVTALNPKGMVFFVAFVPQFVNQSAPVMPQFVILVITFVVLATINVVLWSQLTGSLRRYLERPGFLQWVNRTGATFLVGAGLITATIKQ